MPKWMPDGEHILSGAQSAVYITDTTGLKVTKLQNNTGKMSYYPVCSPDGSMIAWCTDIDAIYLMNVDGTNQRYLTEGTHPTWTPDSKSIVYSKSDNKEHYSYFLWKIGVDGNNMVQITK
jgi:Tol biopolymer transport system component